jgi:hypothetical protein
VPRVGTHSVGKASGRVSQRNEARGARHLRPTPRLAYEYVRIPVELTSLKPEAARTLFPRLIDRNHHFGRLLSEPGLTPLRISTRRRISSVSCASEAFLGGAVQSMHQLAGGEDARCVICFDHIRTRAFFRGLLTGKRPTRGRAKDRPPIFALQ